jgi:hypothetical protein
MTKINMPNFTKSLISLAFLNPGLFYKAKNPLVFKHFICNTLNLNNLQFDGCGTILCSNYISRASGSITFDTMKIEDFGMQTVVQASEQPSARSMVSIDASCTAGGTTQILDRWHGERMLATWRNDAEGKIVMISLHRPATGHGKIQRMACCAGGVWARQNASQAGFRGAPERPSHASHTTILSAIADNALADICYVAMNKTIVRVRAGVLKEKKGNEVMYMTLQQPDQAAFSVDQCASALGIDEFSLLSRIQMGEINAVRARSGEIKISESELERLTPSSLRATPDESGEQQIFSDRSLGIESYLGLRSNGVRPRRYRIPGREGQFSENEIEGYRAGFGAIAKEVDTVKDFAKQLQIERQFPQSDDLEIDMPRTGHWEVGEALLNLKRGEILLCRRGDEFAVIERFDQDSPYAQAKGQAEILMRGNDANQLADEFKANAQRTLEFMASNATAKAQKIVWGQFYDQKPDEIMAAISERCHQAAANQETNSQKTTQSINRGMRV